MIQVLFGFTLGVTPQADDTNVVELSRLDHAFFCTSDAVWVGRVSGHTTIPAGRSHHTLIQLDVERTIVGDTYPVETVLIKDAYGRGWSQVGGPPRRIEPVEGRRFLVALAGDDFRFAYPVDNDADLQRVLDALERPKPCVSSTPLESDTLTDSDVAGWCLADSVWVGRVDGTEIHTGPGKPSIWRRRNTIVDFTVERTLRGPEATTGQVRRRGTYSDGHGWNVSGDDRQRLRPHAGRRYLVAQTAEGGTFFTHPVGGETELTAAMDDLEHRSAAVCVSEL
jgi:hypothetical protein